MSQVSIINIEGNFPEIPTRFDANFGFAIPIANTLEILGSTVPAGVIPVYTTGSGNTITTNVQISQAISSSNINNVGLAAFDSSAFTVDANGFVELVGGGTPTQTFIVDAFTPPGTNPVTPTLLGEITVTGGQVASGVVGINVIHTNSLSANAYTIQIQRSIATVSSDLSLNGVSHYKSSDFSVDSNGFVSLSATGAAKTITGNDLVAISPVANNWNIITANSTVKFLGTALSGTETLNFGLTNLFLGSSGASLTGGAGENAALGSGALAAATSAVADVAVGFQSGNALTIGQNNVYIGAECGLRATIGNSNTVIGAQSFTAYIASGSDPDGNTIIGKSSGNSLTTGRYNLILGIASGNTYGSASSSNICLMNNGAAAESNTIRIGTDGVGLGQQSRAFMAGITGVTVAASAPVAVNASGQLSSLGFGTSGQVLTSNGNLVSPTWQAAGSSQTITGDSGPAISPTASNWNILGQQYPGSGGNKPVVDTIGTALGSFLRIEDRTWISPYVVDASTTVGARGTYSTISSAITAAIADGASVLGNLMLTIVVRPGTYIENITIPSDAALCIRGFAQAFLDSALGIGVLIQGVVTFADDSLCQLYDVVIDPPGAIAATVGSTEKTTINNCNLMGKLQFTGDMTGFTADFSRFERIEATNTATAIDFVSAAKFSSCLVPLSSTLAGTAIAVFFQSSVNFVDLSDTSGLAYYGCKINGEVTGTSTGDCQAYDSFFIAGSNGLFFFNHAGTLAYSNLSVTNGSSLYGTNITKLFGAQSQGNVLNTTSVTSATYNALKTDYYIAVNRAGAVTVTLPNPALICTDQIFTIQDISGAAGTNNITVDTASGTINGGATFLINANYGDATFKSDGTNYFVSDFGSTASTTIVAGPGTTVDTVGIVSTINAVKFTNTTAATLAVNNGYFATAAGTYNLPASASQGDLIIIQCDTSGAVVVDAPTSNFIRIGSSLTSSSGTATSTAIGDSLTLRYRLSTLTWHAVSIVGNWVIA